MTPYRTPGLGSPGLPVLHHCLTVPGRRGPAHPSYVWPQPSVYLSLRLRTRTVRYGTVYSSRRPASVRDTERLSFLAEGHPLCLHVHPLPWSSWTSLYGGVVPVPLLAYRYSSGRCTPPGGTDSSVRVQDTRLSSLAYLYSLYSHCRSLVVVQLVAPYSWVPVPQSNDLGPIPYRTCLLLQAGQSIACTEHQS